MAGALGAALTASACATAGSALNSPRVQLRANIETALREDRLQAALVDAAVYERRAPGPESWSLLGRALWRTGRLTAAEGYFRRAADAGGPDGVLGLAVASAARGDLDGAALHAMRAATDPALTEPSSRLLASLAWRRGDWAAAGDRLRDAAVASDATQRRMLVAMAAAVDRVRERVGAVDGEGPIRWRGAPTRLEFQGNATPTLAVVVGDRPARLAISLRASRSSLTPGFAARAGLAADGDDEAGLWTVASLSLGTIRADAVPFALAPSEGVDGTLGFDVLSTLRWVLWPARRSLVVATPGADLPDADARALERTHWAGVRIPVDLLDAQLLLLPRIASAVIPVSLDPFRPGSIHAQGLARATTHGPELSPVSVGETVGLPVRVGGWRGLVGMRLEEPRDDAPGTLVNPEAVLGADFARHWGFRWAPRDRQLALIEATGAPGR